MFLRMDMGAWALILIAMGIAYFVCLKASKEGTKLFQYGGYVIGVLILVVSLIMAVGNLVTRARRRRPTTRRTTTRTTRPTTTPTLPRRATEPETAK